jgi:hypothetical protein
MDLFIIGNGFDIEHDLNTHLPYFHRYIYRHDKNLLDILNVCYGKEIKYKTWWNQFESNLATPIPSGIIEIESIIKEPGFATFCLNSHKLGEEAQK